MLTLGTVPPPPPAQPPYMPGEINALDWSHRLSLEIIRTHTKTDEIPTVTDEQLAFYRACAVEAAEKYTGMLLAANRTVTELAQSPASARYKQMSYMLTYMNIAYLSRPPRTGMTYAHRMQWPSADGTVYLYGGRYRNEQRILHIKPGSRVVSVPIQTGWLDMTNCCDPCSSHYYNEGMMLAYRAGFGCVDDVPNGVVLGMLMYLAWALMHPGDELLTQRNRIETRAGLAGLQGSNNIAMVSGALELWRTFDNEAF